MHSSGVSPDGSYRLCPSVYGQPLAGYRTSYSSSVRCWWWRKPVSYSTRIAMLDGMNSKWSVQGCDVSGLCLQATPLAQEVYTPNMQSVLRNNSLSLKQGEVRSYECASDILMASHLSLKQPRPNSLGYCDKLRAFSGKYGAVSEGCCSFQDHKRWGYPKSGWE